jgi:diguanylate cyclase (GGDEF)-like protein
VEAIVQVEKHQPQLIITDWMMPVMDGLTLCRNLRERVEWRDIYMIVMTAQEDPDKLVEAFEAGADDYLVKPIIQKIFFSRLRAGLRVVKLQEELAADREQLLRLSTDLAEANEGLQLLALTDVLTTLPNRRAALERLEQEWALTKRGNRNFTCMMVDVDCFKSINDRYGHPVGDEVLKSVAAVLRRVARGQDMVCRYGGEEFLVICPDTDVVEGSLCAERMRQSVMASHVQSGVHNIKVTVSIGLAERKAGMSSLEEVLSLSDQHLYLAKQTGRNKIIFK